MKIRSGFVSNSSSSSFIIAVPSKVEVCKCCQRSDDWMMQAISTYIATLTEKGNEMWTMTSAEQVEEYFKDELDKLIASKKYAEMQLGIIEEIEQEPKIFENYLKLRTQLDGARNRLTLVQEAQMGITPNPKKEIAERKKSIQAHLKGHTEKVKSIKDIIAKMKMYHSKDYKVYAFTIDNWATKAEEALKRLINEGKVEVIDIQIS